MNGQERKAAIAAYKEREVVAGIYEIRCAPAGLRWVGSATNVASVWTRESFGLRQGGHMNRAMQAAWNDHGPEGFAFEVLERLEEETPIYARDRWLKDRRAHWMDALGARPL